MEEEDLLDEDDGLLRVLLLDILLWLDRDFEEEDGSLLPFIELIEELFFFRVDEDWRFNGLLLLFLVLEDKEEDLEDEDGLFLAIKDELCFLAELAELEDFGMLLLKDLEDEREEDGFLRDKDPVFFLLEEELDFCEVILLDEAFDRDWDVLLLLLLDCSFISSSLTFLDFDNVEDDDKSCCWFLEGEDFDGDTLLLVIDLEERDFDGDILLLVIDLEEDFDGDILLLVTWNGKVRLASGEDGATRFIMDELELVDDEVRLAGVFFMTRSTFPLLDNSPTRSDLLTRPRGTDLPPGASTYRSLGWLWEDELLLLLLAYCNRPSSTARFSSELTRAGEGLVFLPLLA